jgi:hypothetical protein
MHGGRKSWARIDVQEVRSLFDGVEELSVDRDEKVEACEVDMHSSIDMAQPNVENEIHIACAERLFPTHGIVVVIHTKTPYMSNELPASSSATSSASPSTALMTLLKASALLSARPTRTTESWAHALTSHLHKRAKVHLTRVHALA